MNRAALKLDAKSLLNAHFKFFFLLFLPVFILELVGGFMSAPREDYYDAQLNANMPVWSGEQTLGTILILRWCIGLHGCLLCLRRRHAPKIDLRPPVPKINDHL